MKKNIKKHIGFTMAETLVVVLIIGIIALAMPKVSKLQLQFAKKCGYYASFVNLKRIVGETVAAGYLPPQTVTQAQVNAALADTAAALAYWNSLPATVEVNTYPDSNFCKYHPEAPCGAAFNAYRDSERAWEALIWCGTVNNTYDGYWASSSTTSLICTCPMVRGDQWGSWTAYYQDFPSQAAFDSAYQSSYNSYASAEQNYSDIMNTPTGTTTQTNPEYTNAQNAYNAKKAVSDNLAAQLAAQGSGTLESALPLHGYVGDGTGLCERFASSLNSVGTINCNISSTPIFNASTLNFALANGVKYYNLGVDPTNVSGTDKTQQIFTIYIDVDGNKGDSILNVDVMPFTVDRIGLVLPAPTSSGANDVNYLSTNIKYTNASGTVSWLARGIPYRQAVCQSGEYTASAYCNGNANYSTTYTKRAECNVANTKCEVIINKP